MIAHRLPVFCPKCKQIALTQEVYFTADGRVVLDAWCQRCQKALEYQNEVALVIQTCKDMENPKHKDFDLEAWKPPKELH